MTVPACIFCTPDREILTESPLSVAFFDGFPVSKGHALVVPKRHVATIWDMTEDEYVEAFALVRKVKDFLAERLNPDGFNVGVNCGEVAGQSVWHAHIHVIPRYKGMCLPRAAACVTSSLARTTTSGSRAVLLPSADHGGVLAGDHPVRVQYGELEVRPREGAA
jgi:diadenosine tetraphosphate (Ap4A) HIT family hydrolase